MTTKRSKVSRKKTNANHGEDEEDEGGVAEKVLMTIKSINITALTTSTEILATMKGHLIFLQETAATEAVAKKCAKYLR